MKRIIVGLVAVLALAVFGVLGAAGTFSGSQETVREPSSTVEAQETTQSPTVPGPDASAPVDAEEIISNIPREQIESDLLQGQTQYLKTCDGLVTVGMALAEAPPIYHELETALDELWIAYDCKA